MSWRPTPRRRRPSAHQRGLGVRWRRIRDVAVQLEPWCHNSRCPYPDAGTATNPLTGEHRVKRRDGGEPIATNTTVLCHRCNSAQLTGARLDDATITELARF